MPTLAMAEFADGQVRFELDYDASLRATAFRCVNGTALPAHAFWSRPDGTNKAERDFPANATTAITINTGAAQRIQLTDASVAGAGKLAGYAAGFAWPAA
jgi:hypothetical protein